ncbi:methyl-accepting chemotaxis protein [Alcaligenes endophyticus]|uniref:Methyl-accepting chemotaxis protein n=1 Tax=Alcaligenes endophyticus TaxID=1929088 RepID=A0ABT8EI18_9BURK|nr:PAS domain-containing methyl-accepting chemotaxis protein [Alcaligenes endophyticus]MCX5592740.1 methyl-accepting chemotaxis protein [Alcaligenes endophyticus]MDN4120928.1 methyl-accepting chemotaxis protein [Alcaligenes endophyticus]
MRKNFPINNTETVIQDDQYLISKTDTKGRIVYANPAFIEISGFSQEELTGQAHNIVRHPDMPQEVFADLWTTLKNGEAWEGIVKNRRKDGGFYWVKANAGPIIEQGVVTGYASVRTRAQKEEINQAEQFYQQLNQGSTGPWRVQKGRIVRGGWTQPFYLLARLWSSDLGAAFARSILLTLIVALSLALSLHYIEAPNSSKHLLSAALTAGLIVLLAAQLRLRHRTLKSFNNAAQIAQQIAAGNLGLDMQEQQLTELGKLGTNLELMRKSLLSISTDVDQSVLENLDMAQLLSQNSRQLDVRTVEQAASLQQTTASLANFSSTVHQTAANAQASHELSQRSSEYVQKGNHTVAELSLAMNAILASSEKIRGIVRMIEHIAFQTNILSINASIESARAGTAGRGFAVVASEVRTLARQASEAAEQIKGLIEDTCSQSRNGAEHTKEVELAMHDILKSSSEVALLMAEISAATGEQSTGLEQLNLALQQVDKITTDNADLARNLHHSVESMNHNQAQLRDAIAVFNYGDKKAIMAPLDQVTARTKTALLPQ